MMLYTIVDERDNAMSDINTLAERAYATAKAKGFWDDEDAPSNTTLALAWCAHSVISNVVDAIENLRRNELTYYSDIWRELANEQLVDWYIPHKIKLLSKLALIVSEVGEAIKAVQKNDLSNMGEELADIIIRTLDVANRMGIDVDQAIEAKQQYNESRPAMHGKRA